MKKTLFLSIALTVGAMVFTACEKGGNNGNGQGSEPVDPTQVTQNDLIGEWRMDSIVTDYGKFYHRSLVVFTDKYIISGDSTEYTYKNGVISTYREEYDEEKQETVLVPMTQEVFSFDRGLKCMVILQKNVRQFFWSEEKQEEVEVTADIYIYYSMLPQMTGTEQAITEANVKGAWLEEYTDFRQSPYPMTRGVNGHYMYYYFGDNHIYMNLMAVSLNPINAFDHPGYWQFADGKIKYMTAYTGQTYEDMDFANRGQWYTVVKLTDKYMVLRTTWNGQNSDGEETIYLRRVELPKMPQEE